MNTIAELIERYCPEGVEFLPLGKLAKVQKQKNKAHLTEDAFSITQRGLIRTSEYFGEKTQITSKDTSNYYLVYKNWFVYSPSRIDVGSFNYLKVDGPVIVSPLDVVFSIDESKIIPQYLMAYLSTKRGMFQILSHRLGIEGTGRKLLPFSEFAKIEIPVPPLSVQHKIVEILDKFTSLEAELEAELEARKKQYEYYRNQLLDFTGREDVERIVFNEICDVINGRAYKQSELLSSGKYRVLRVGNFFSNDSWYYSDLELEDKYYCQNGDLLYAWSASFGPHIWEEEKVIYHYHIWKLVCKEVVDKRFLFYWLQSNDMECQVSSEKHGATMAHLTKAMIEKLIVPLPSLEEQHRIVTILDKFEALINGQTASLSAEIKARHQQYEYYRDKLLCFKHK